MFVLLNDFCLNAFYHKWHVGVYVKHLRHFESVQTLSHNIILTLLATHIIDIYIHIHLPIRKDMRSTQVC